MERGLRGVSLVCDASAIPHVPWPLVQCLPTPSALTARSPYRFRQVRPSVLKLLFSMGCS